MLRSPLPSRSVLLAAIAALAALSAGAGPSGAQAPAAPPPIRPVVADPVSTAVAEASRRFGVPADWIWSVMRVESAGRTRAVSHAGAMGLMQVMPQTYAELRSRYGLGPDPFDVRDNIMAGAAYLREMFDRYGATGMLAAYNAGPGRWEAHVRAGRPLPTETVGYLARLGPVIGANGVVMPVVAPAQRGPAALRPTLFVQIGGAPAAAPVQSDEPLSVVSDGGRSAAARLTDGLFVLRPASPALAAEQSLEDGTPASGRGVEPVPTKPTSSLFVSLSAASERQ